MGSMQVPIDEVFEEGLYLPTERTTRREGERGRVQGDPAWNKKDYATCHDLEKLLGRVVLFGGNLRHGESRSWPSMSIFERGEGTQGIKRRRSKRGKDSVCGIIGKGSRTL